MPKRKPDSEEEELDQSEEANVSDNKPSTSKKKTKAKVQPLTVKKPKIDSDEEPTGADGAKSQIRTNAEGNKYIDLGKKRRAVVRPFKGMALLDIREYYGAEGDEKPGKKGISLQLEQWRALRDASSTIDELFGMLKN